MGPVARISLALVALLCFVSCDGRPLGPPDASPPAGNPRPDPVAEGAPVGDLNLRTVYVPAYSHLPRGVKMDDRALFSILLSVRNVDSTATVTLAQVDYFDTSGHRVRRYLDAPRALRPLETAEFTVATHDDAGGSGANFLVYWEGPSDAHPLLTEAVMLGHLGGGYVAFSSRGVELERRPDPRSFTTGELVPIAPPDTEPSAE